MIIIPYSSIYKNNNKKKHITEKDFSEITGFDLNLLRNQSVMSQGIECFKNSSIISLFSGENHSIYTEPLNKVRGKK
jgi:hypothetical protein